MRLAFALLLCACAPGGGPSPDPAPSAAPGGQHVERLNIADVCTAIADAVCALPCAGDASFRTCVWRHVVACCGAAETCAVPSATARDEIDRCARDIGLAGCDAGTLPSSCDIVR